MIKAKSFFLLAAIFLFSVFSCKSYKKQEEALPDSFDRGTIHISADESFKPIIDEHVKVYESNFPGTKIIVDYKPEAECLKDFLVDTVRMVIATRRFSQQEANMVTDSLKVELKGSVVARDAIAVIMNPESGISSFTMDDVRQILKGSFNKDLIPVFDGIKATSTVRFIIDSILRGDSLTGKAIAARSSEGVIDYISRTKNAVGFIGVSWIGNREDTMHLGFLKKVKIIPIEGTYVKGEFVFPSQADIFTMRYPMVRDLVYILKEKHRGLGRAFANFLGDEKGQLIFRRAYLVPTKRDFRLREAHLNE